VFWVIVVAMAVVVGGAALVALGGGGSLPEAEHDRLSARLPQDRPLSRFDVDELRLPMALRGYRMDEVDDVLDRLGAELALRDSRIAELEAVAAVRGAVEAGGAGTGEQGGEPLPGLEAFAKVVEQPAEVKLDKPAQPAADQAADQVAEQAADERDGEPADHAGER